MYPKTRSQLSGVLIATLIVVAAVAVTSGQNQPPAGARVQATPQTPPAGQAAPSQGRRQNPRLQVPMDPDRARELYVSKDPKDQSIGTDYQRDIASRQAADARYPGLCKGIIDYA